MIELFNNTDWVTVAVVGVLAAERVGKAIPNEATGFLGFLRGLGKLAGLYVANRNSSDDRLN